MKLALLALACLSLAILVWPARDPSSLPQPAPDSVVGGGADTRPSAAALSSEARSAADGNVLQSPDPKELQPPVLSAGEIRRLLGKMERDGPLTARDAAPSVPPDEAAADFAAGFREALAEHERNAP